MRDLMIALLAVLSLFASGVVFAGDAGYLRYPDVHGESVAFVAEGDLWIGSTGGGTARRLTTHVGSEAFPRFSPNGSQIAFTGQYDGNADVFVISAGGGEPRRLTWHPSGDNVLGWSPDGRDILFVSRARARARQQRGLPRARERGRRREAAAGLDHPPGYRRRQRPPGLHAHQRRRHVEALSRRHRALDLGRTSEEERLHRGHRLRGHERLSDVARRDASTTCRTSAAR